jgi:hypothetical protein
MSLSKKYGISQEVINKMVVDGVISCLYPRNEEICNMYRTLMAKGRNKMQAYSEIAEACNISERSVMDIIKKMS